MYGIFMESLVIFKLYTGLKPLLLLTAVMWIYLLIKEKNKNIRLMFVYVPILILVLFHVPYCRKVFVGAGLDGETYYRIIWTIPMGMITAYGACSLFAKHKRIGLAVTSVLIVLCGSLVYKSDYITKAENLYHIPDAVIKVCDLIAPEKEESRVTALMPPELIHFVRQYDARINMPYGREMLVERWGYIHEVYDVMEKPETIVMEDLLEASRKYYCEYIVLTTQRKTDVDPEEAGLTLLAVIDGYRVYQDPVTVEVVSEWSKYYEDEE